MKRVVALLMTLVLLAGCSSALAESTFFSSTVLSAMDYDVDAWTENSTTRAAFAVIAAVEYMTERDSTFDIDFDKDIFVSKAEDMVGLLFCISGDSTYTYLLYSPELGIFLYDPEQDLGTDSTAIKAALAQTADSYYTVTATEFATVATSIANAIDSEE